MKRQLLVAAMIMISAISLGQKKELKKAEKAIKDGEFSEALTLLNTAEGLISGADDETKSLLYTLKGQSLVETANGNFDTLKLAVEALKKANALGGTEGRTSDVINSLKTALVNSAVEDQKKNDFKVATEKLYTTYNLSKSDTLFLFYAAGSAVNGGDFDTAVTYYQELLDVGYTGITTELVATEKATGEVKSFNTKNERDLYVKTGEYIKPDIRVTPSKKGEILKNMTLIYGEKGEIEKAAAVVQKARKESPDDVDLMKVEANLAYTMGDLDKYNSLMEQIVKTDPDNPELYYNLGVGAASNGQTDRAVSYYEKALKINPDYTNALLNIGILKLSEEKVIVDQMNSLGTSREDNLKYDQLKEERKKMYLSALPYLERAISSNPDGNNEELMKTLMNIYSQIGEDAKFKAMKSKVDALGN